MSISVSCAPGSRRLSPCPAAPSRRGSLTPRLLAPGARPARMSKGAATFLGLPLKWIALVLMIAQMVGMVFRAARLLVRWPRKD